MVPPFREQNIADGELTFLEGTRTVFIGSPD
jgi:hypothetical protein